MVVSDIDYYLGVNDKKVKFNTQEFIDILNLCKNIKTSNLAHPQIGYEEFPESPSRENIAFFLNQTISQYEDILGFNNVFNSDWKILSMPKGEHDKTTKIYGNFCGINSNSKYKDEAWEFIKFLLSEKIQAFNNPLNGIDGIPMNNKARKILALSTIEDQKKYKQNKPERFMEKNLYLITAADINTIDSIANNIGKYSYNRTDKEITKIIGEQLDLFLEDEISAEETAKRIQNKIEIMINE
jgi:ABC-type glycerol-3-phosphate transport system substrate-binding protein